MSLVVLRAVLSVFQGVIFKVLFSVTWYVVLPYLIVLEQDAL